MAGGTWTTQNKARPGVYINVAAQQAEKAAVGDRGTLTMPMVLSWGATGTLMEISMGEDVFSKLGYAVDDILLLREAFKRAKKVLLYRVNSDGVKATKTISPLTVTAKYPGVRGNDIKIVITPDVDENGVFRSKYNVTTLVDGVEVENQLVADIGELVANDFVTFSGTGTPVASAGASLVNGTDGTAVAADYSAYLDAAARADFDIMAVPVSDSEIKALCSAFAKQMRETEGKRIQVVLSDYATADYEGVISVKNGVVLKDGTVIDKVKAVAWVGGAEAAAGISESLTYAAYDDAVSADTVYTNTEIEAALAAGELLFSDSYGRIVVEQDINTLVAYGTAKNESFSKNRVIRTLDGFCNDLKKACDTYYVGKISNDTDGRNTIRAYAIRLAAAYQNEGALQNFDSENDITVAAGKAIDAMILTAALQPVDSVEKIYTTVTVGEE